LGLCGEARIETTTSRNGPDYLEKVIKSESDVKKMHIILVLKEIDVPQANYLGCSNILKAMVNRIELSGRYAHLDVDIKRDEKWTDLGFVEQVYKETSATWLKALDQIWGCHRLIITTPILGLAKNLCPQAYCNHIYKQINGWPFLGAMLRDDSDATLTILASMDHIQNHDHAGNN